MNDALLMSGIECRSDLNRNPDRVGERGRTVTREPVRQRFTLDQRHHKGASGARLFEAVDLRDVRMIQAGQRLRFPLETRPAARGRRQRCQAGF